ncbi:glycosyltransferase [Patescibacteria group bacterium]|nr:glycosyltransferase [Patescibacteria group bacterium]MBU1931517.1 glycosyltransferase [Patescibacteria group bacterium]
MKLAIVHDYLFDYGGAERVLEALHEIWPKAPVYTAFYSPQSLGSKAKHFENWDIRTTWFDRLPGKEKLVSPLRFLAPWVWGSLDLSQYDLVISSAAWFITKGFSKSKSSVEICYCHTPPRYLYGYQTSRNWRKYWPIKVYGMIVNHFLRQYDFNQAQKVDYFVANSEEIRQRIKKFYRRQAEIIYPPVQTETKTKVKSWRQGRYYLYVGKLSEAKRPDLAIQACQKLGKKLKIVGGGPWEGYLKSLKGSKVQFLGRVEDKQLWQLYQNCRAVIFPAVEEDFGIVPVEAMSWGKPVVALRSGGVKETVIEDKTGIFFNEPEVSSLVEAINQLEKSSICSQDCCRQAKQFSQARFKKEITAFVKTALDKK